MLATSREVSKVTSLFGTDQGRRREGTPKTSSSRSSRINLTGKRRIGGVSSTQPGGSHGDCVAKESAPHSVKGNRRYKVADKRQGKVENSEWAGKGPTSGLT